MKILICGLGAIARKHIAAIGTIEPGAQIYALRSTRQSVLLEGVNNLYSWEDVDSVDFDFAIVSNPTSQHLATVNRLLTKNIPLFIEKPLDCKLVDEQWVKAVEATHLSYCACNLRFLSCLKFFKEKLLPGLRVNEVNVYCGSYLPDWRPGADFRKVYSAIPELGGGVHIDLIHEIDYVYWMFGKPQSVQKRFSHKSSLDIRAVDYANYLLDYDGFSANIVLNYFRRDYKRTAEFVCDDATYLVDLAENAVYKAGGKIFQSDKRIIDTYFTQMQYFINCVKNNERTFNSVEDAANVLNICLQ